MLPLLPDEVINSNIMPRERNSEPPLVGVPRNGSNSLRWTVVSSAYAHLNLLSEIGGRRSHQRAMCPAKQPWQVEGQSATKTLV